MEAFEIQLQFFNYVKNSLPPHISMVDELCELLDLSSDSVYRRIRGEKLITLQEVKSICQHYHISLDQIVKLENDTVVFRASEINATALDFTGYLSSMLAQLRYFNSFKNNRMFYLAKDLTIFHFYVFPEIAAFKTFFWRKTIQNDPDLNNKMFSFDFEGNEECYALGQQVLQEYNKIPSVELWNVESILSTTHQIEYYRDGGILRDRNDLLRIVESLEKMLDHLQHQCEKGVKFMPGAKEVSYKASLQLYINEVILGSNTILMDLDGAKLSFVTYNVLHYLMTKDPRFNEKTFSNFNTILSRSSLISGTGERDRNKFFNKLREKVAELKK